MPVVTTEASPPAPPASPVKVPRRFEYVPALDGVRAVALLAVMAYHCGFTAGVPGGLFSLDAFFCLSGFLITSLLVAEWHRSAGIRLRAFWARRLMPAVVLTVVGVTLVTHFLVPTTFPAGRLRLDSLATLAYVANWHFILVGQNYFDQTGPTSPLIHTWSLAVEEQFYLLWPVLVLFVLSRTRKLWPLLTVALAGATASALEMAVLYNGTNSTRVYFGSDTHAQSLLIGAALGVAVHLWRERQGGPTAALCTTARSKALLTGAGVLGAAVTAYLWARIPFSDVLSFRGGVALASLAVAALIASIVLVPTNPLARILSFAPLRYIGRISYGMYLWHWPLDLWINDLNTDHHLGLGIWPLAALKTAAAVGVGTASFYLVERPIRQGTFFTSLRAWIVGPPALAGATALIVLGTVAPAAAIVPPVAPAKVVPATGPPVKVLLVGDSVAVTIGFGLDEAQKPYNLTITDDGTIGCGVAVGPAVKVLGQELPTINATSGYCFPDPPPPLQTWEQYWTQEIDRLHPNLVVLIAGRWEVVDRLYQGRWTNILDPTFAAYVKIQLQEAVTVATAGGAHLVLETAPCYDTGVQPSGAPWPEDDPRRLAVYNGLVRQVAAANPASTTLQDLDADACPGGKYTPVMDGVQIRDPSDGVHFTLAVEPNGGTAMAPRLLPLWVTLGQEARAAQQQAGLPS